MDIRSQFPYSMLTARKQRGKRDFAEKLVSFLLQKFSEGDFPTITVPLRDNRFDVRHLFCSFILLAGILLAGSMLIAQNIPQELVGKWVIKRQLPTLTISCWGEKEAKAIIGTHIEYTPDSFRWTHIVINHPTVEVTVVSAEQFERENSSPSVNGSQVSFRQLGINAPEAKQIIIKHAPAEITRATTEIPGDEVLLKSRNSLVFSVCNVYFEANRLRPREKGRQ